MIHRDSRETVFWPASVLACKDTAFPSGRTRRFGVYGDSVPVCTETVFRSTRLISTPPDPIPRSGGIYLTAGGGKDFLRDFGTHLFSLG